MYTFSAWHRSVPNWFTALVLVVLVLSPVLPTAQPAFADPPPTSFADEFDSPTLDPAWQVVEFTGTRVYGFTSPANHISLADNPGHLRYYLDPMTHFDGFLNNYQTTYSYHSCCNHDPGLELHRLFSGDAWTLDVKASYYMPFSNGRDLTLRVYFGDGGPGTYYLHVGRSRDGPWPPGTPETAPVLIRLAYKAGPNLSDIQLLEDVSAPPTPLDTYFYRLERDGGIVTVKWSTDGLSWTTAFHYELGTQLNGLEQRMVITGHSWFTPANSYADYDYIRLQPSNAPPDCSQAYPSTSTLWSPGHVFVPIDVMDVTDPDDDPVVITIDSIWQDEPVDTFGDGRFTPDGMGVGTATASVRAERSGTGDGRVYHVSFTAADGQGGTCSGEVQVSVPHDQSRVAVDGGRLYDSTLP